MTGTYVRNNKENAMSEIRNWIEINFVDEEEESVPTLNSWEYLKFKYFLIAICLILF